MHERRKDRHTYISRSIPAQDPDSFLVNGEPQIVDRGLGSIESSCNDIRERAEGGLEAGVSNNVLEIINSVAGGVDEVDECVIIRERGVCDALIEYK